MTKQVKKNTKMLTPSIILSYPALAKPAKGEHNSNATPKYQISIPWPKEYQEELYTMMSKVAEDMWGPKHANLKGVTHFVVDCDDDPKYENDPVYADCLKFSAKNKKQPQCLGPDGEVILQENLEDELYAGCIVRASINVYATEAGGKKTVAFQLDKVMKIRDGKRLGGGSTAEEDFADLDYSGDQEAPPSGGLF